MIYYVCVNLINADKQTLIILVIVLVILILIAIILILERPVRLLRVWIPEGLTQTNS